MALDFSLRNFALLIFAFNVLCMTNAQEPEFEDLSPLSTVYETDRLPEDSRYIASIGNGHVATTLYTDAVFMNGLYNGVRGESHRARIPSRNNIRVNFTNEILSQRYALDVAKGIFVENITTLDYEIKITSYAHHFYNRVIVTQITVTPLQTEPEPLLLTIESIMGDSSEDIAFEPDKSFNCQKLDVPCVYTCGHTMLTEDPAYQQTTTPVCVIATTVDSKNPVLISEKVTYTFFASYGGPDIMSAEVDFRAVENFVSLGYHDNLLKYHTDAWDKVWNDGRIEVGGNVQLEKVIYGSLYYILSSLPVTTGTRTPLGQFYGLSPGGLGYGTYLRDYQGHSFWDTEIWMYPPILYFYPSAAKELLNYRLHVIDAARDRANDTGYAGARFPWESGFTGREVTPDCCPETRDFQIHITADIAFAIRQYIAVTRDDKWLKQKQDGNLVNGCGIIHEIAEFWASRTVCDAGKDFCEINDVMPPDEDHHHVNNSVYTNVMAGYSIFFAKYAKCLCNTSMDEVPEKWVDNAKALKLIYDEELKYHPEFDDYKNGTSIKQADVVLLGFPLMYKMDPEIRKNDLNIYEPVTRPDGPAMTWAMHTIGFLDLDELDRAEIIFNRSYNLYVREPYKIWTEAQPPTLGAVNFITGMGGFLQSIISGYGGLRLYPESIVFSKPRLPPQTTFLKLTGINFLDNEFNLLVEENAITVTLTRNSTTYPIVLEDSEGQSIPIVGNTAIIDATAGPVTFTLKTTTETNCPLPLDEIKLVPIQGDNSTTEASAGVISANAIVLCLTFLTLFDF